MFDLLAVKVYRYLDEMNYYMEANDYLWQMLIVPENIKVVTLEAARKFRPYGGSDRMYCWQMRPYHASLLLKKFPAKWVAVFDADVIPLRRNALMVLRDKLNHMPEDVVGVCYQSFYWQQRFYPPTPQFRLGFDVYSEGIGDGIHVLRASFLDKALYKYVFLSWLIADRVSWPEPNSPSVWHPKLKIGYLGERFCYVCQNVKDAEWVFREFNPYFIHYVNPSNRRSDYLELLLFAASVIEKGIVA